MKIHSKSEKYKAYPIIRAIHLNVTNQRRRFMTDVDPAFKDLFDLMCQDDFDINILTDEGKASASPKLMAAIENGNRELAQRSVHCFGAMAAKDPEAYVCVLAILHFVCTCDFNNIHLRFK